MFGSPSTTNNILVVHNFLHDSENTRFLDVLFIRSGERLVAWQKGSRLGSWYLGGGTKMSAWFRSSYALLMQRDYLWFQFNEIVTCRFEGDRSIDRLRSVGCIHWERLCYSFMSDCRSIIRSCIRSHHIFYHWDSRQSYGQARVMVSASA